MEQENGELRIVRRNENINQYYSRVEVVDGSFKRRAKDYAWGFASGFLVLLAAYWLL